VAINAATVGLFWAPLAVLVASLSTWAVQRDRATPLPSGRRHVLAAATTAAALVLTATTAALAWNAHQQQVAEREALQD
jgi:hypothetical protein